MIKRPRIIPTLLIDEDRLVKTTKFNKPNYLGDPINAIKIFNEKGVDELCILDISATKNEKKPNFDLLERMASESFMPLAYGGGINSIEQIKVLFRIGFEKVVLNTSFIKRENLVKEAAAYFGTQSIVVSIDYRRTLFNKKCYIEDGKTKVNKSPIELALRAEELGAGEILLYSIDNDGVRNGYDLETIKEVCDNVHLPVIACGGANTIDDIKIVLDSTKASAVAAGSLFVYYGKKNGVLINFPREEVLFEKGIYVRENDDRI